MGCVSFVGLISVQISVDPSTGFSVTGISQWEALSSSMAGLPVLLTYRRELTNAFVRLVIQESWVPAAGLTAANLSQ